MNPQYKPLSLSRYFIGLIDAIIRTQSLDTLSVSISGINPEVEWWQKSNSWIAIEMVS